ncbi:MAG TPA: hypothetical protein VHR86_07680, partial [Armatimonadota bacterium]|nr:hypothetical protein [Armatimonadota bacterium]
KVDALLGSFNLTTLLSEERAQVHTDSFQGNNSAGPYQLKYSPILDGTEQVRVDGQLKKLGVDYTLEYNTGVLYFQSTMLIPATSLIEVSYEYAGYGQNPGLLTGMRGELPLGKAGRLGATYIAQTSRVGSSSTDSLQRTDRFIGENRPMELQLQYRPVKKINLITVDGVPQTEGKDYTVTNLSSGVISFLKIVPAPPGLATDAAANVIVEYEVDNSDTTTSGGDRSILGLDGSFNLGKTSIIGLQFAHSSSATSGGGNALSLRGNTNLGNLSLGFNLRDSSDTFSAIESVGFQQRERAIDGNLEYKPVEHIRLTASMSSSKRPYTSYTSGSSSSDTSDTVEKMLNALQNSFGVVFDYPNLPRLEFGHQSYRTNGSSTDTASAITNMRLQYTPFNGFNFSANLDHTANNDYSSLGGSATSFTQRYNASYTPGSRFSVQADFTNSNLHSRTLSAATTTTSSESDTGSDVTVSNAANRATSGNLTMTYSPFSFATLTASYRVADSGSGTGGFSNGYYSSSYSNGSYMNTGSYSVGNSYTGDYYSSYSSYSSSSSLYNSSSYSTYTSSKLAALMRSRETTDTTDTSSTTTTTTDTDSTRIRNISRSIGLQLNPLERLNLSFTFGHDLQEGVLTGSNSVSTNVAMAFNYTPMNLVSLNGQLTRQRYTFIGAGGSSSSNIAALGTQIGPWNKLTLALNLQSMTSDTGLSTTSTTTTGSTS